MIINHSVLHILDFNSDICVFSQKELNLDSSSIKDFIEKHLAHAKSDSRGQPGAFLEESWFFSSLKAYVNSRIDFIAFSTEIANSIYENLLSEEKVNSVDLLVADFSENDDSFIAFLLMNSRLAYTHQVVKNDGTIQNEIIQHFAILPNISQKLDSFAIINKRTAEIIFVDKRRYINGKDVFILKEKVLHCLSNSSSRDVLKEVNGIVSKIAEANGINSAVALSKAKNYIFENSEFSDTLSTEELGKEVFADSDDLQHEYKELIQSAKLPEEIKLEKSLAVRTGRNHKIKTDTGIEITFPAEYFENHDFIEFINNPDGTISIELKNIGKIINK